MKNKVISLFLSLVLVISFSACSSEKTVEMTGDQKQYTPKNEYEAQDMCVLAYFDALIKNDADRILQISSSSTTRETFSSSFNSDFMGDLYSITQTSDLMENTSQFIYSILSDFDISNRSADYTQDQITKFIRDVDPVNLRNIEIIALGTPLEQPKVSVPEGMTVDMSIFSCRYCLFSIGGKAYYQLFWLVKSGDNYNLTSIGAFDGIHSGMAIPINIEDFDVLVDQKTLNKPSLELLTASANVSGGTTFLQKINKTPSPSFNNPHDAISFFVDAIAREDVYAALSAFSIKEKAANLDLYKLSDRLRHFLPYEKGGMTSEYEFYRDINLAINCCEKAAGIIRLMASFTFSVNFDPASTPDDYFSAIQNSCKAVSSISLVRSDVFADTVNDDARELLREQAAVYGADGGEHRIVEYSFNGEKFTGSVELIDYGGNWRIQVPYSGFLNLPAMVPVIPSSEVDYDSYI